MLYLLSELRPGQVVVRTHSSHTPDDLGFWPEFRVTQVRGVKLLCPSLEALFGLLAMVFVYICLLLFCVVLSTFL